MTRRQAPSARSHVQGPMPLLSSSPSPLSRLRRTVAPGLIALGLITAGAVSLGAASPSVGHADRAQPLELIGTPDSATYTPPLRTLGLRLTNPHARPYTLTGPRVLVVDGPTRIPVQVSSYTVDGQPAPETLTLAPGQTVHLLLTLESSTIRLPTGRVLELIVRFRDGTDARLTLQRR